MDSDAVRLDGDEGVLLLNLDMSFPNVGDVRLVDVTPHGVDFAGTGCTDVDCLTVDELSVL